MDLYTASERLARAFVVDAHRPALGRHGLVGDGASAALVGVDGSVDWLCLPRFDSPSVFASLLDAERGGRLRVAPALRGFEALQAYDSQTCVLQTLFRAPGHGVAVLTDFMPWTGDPRSSIHELHRLLEVRDGTLPMEIVFDPRFGYGHEPARLEVTEHGAVAHGPDGVRLTLSVGDGVRLAARPEGGVSARFQARTGSRLWFVLSHRSPRPEPIAAYRPFEHLRATRRFWRGWAGRLRYDGPWRHDVLRSALTLKLLQYAPSGALVAAPTTSLPVGSDGARNWDYRYSWTRDSALAIRAMTLIGYREEARDFFHFVRDTVDQNDDLALMVAIDGAPVPEERVVEHLRGHDGRGPVRVGNAARDQDQLDITGALLDAAYLYERSGETLSVRLWRHVRRLVDQAIERVRQPDHGIWEPRTEPAHHVHSKLMTWVAVDRALRLAPLFGGDRSEKRWLRSRQGLEREILERGFDFDAGTFVGEYGGREVDATLLLMPLYGFLPADDPRVRRTLDRIRKELSHGPFLRRYDGGDGIDADEGAFVLCGFWLAEALALEGRLDGALEVFHEHVRATNHLGLLAEEIDPADRSPLGNFPQAFSHLGLIQAAARLDLALRLRDEGRAAPPRLPFDPPEVR